MTKGIPTRETKMQQNALRGFLKCNMIHFIFSLCDRLIEQCFIILILQNKWSQMIHESGKVKVLTTKHYHTQEDNNNQEIIIS